MKIAKIGIWFLFFICLLAGLLFPLIEAAVARIPESALLPSSDDAVYFHRFEKRLADFENRPHPRTVLIGPCYSTDFGDEGAFSNLSLEAIKCGETLRFLDYCEQDDKVLFLFSLREMIEPYKVARRSSLLKTTRILTIFKALIELRQPSAEASSYKQRRRDEKQASELISRCLEADDFPSLRPLAVKGEIEYLKEFNSVSISPLFRLKQKHPNILFILSPTLAVPRKESEMELQGLLNHYADLRNSLRFQLASSGLPCIDLSDFLDSSEMHDCFHHTPEGTQRLKTKVEQIASDLS